jgi:uncharacterized protein YkwD
MFRVVCYIVCFLTLTLPLEFNAQALHLKALHNEVEMLERDSIHLIEKKAAYHFHRLLNEYRASNGLDTLRWHESLWLTCRNHNAWMKFHDELSHTQTPGTEYFSGKSPGDRYDYATQKKGKHQWSGENALYNFSAHGENINHISKNIAQNCLEQWKKSPGHNKNMLAGKHVAHGVSFMLDGSKVWGTDLFAYNAGGTESALVALNDIQKINKHLESKKKQSVNEQSGEVKKVTRRFLKQEIEKALLEDNGNNNLRSFKTNPYMMKSAQKHADYMASVKKTGLKEDRSKRKFYATSTMKRLIKASCGISLIRFGNKKIIEEIAMIETDENTIHTETITSELKKALSEQGNHAISGRSTGIGIAIKKQNDKLLIFVSRIRVS